MSVPRLRFKEFDGNWSAIVLKDFVSFTKGKGISKADIAEDGENFCIRYGELYTTYGQVINEVISKTNIKKSESVLSKAGDVIIPASGETQIDIATASCVLQSDVILSGDLNILSHQENGEWLAYYLSSAKKLEIAQLAQGNSVVHLYASQLKDIRVNKPSKEEQTKIASFLSQVDEKIRQLSEKHRLLSQYKQGMMQKLFSQQLRFKADDGSEFGEWEEVKLGDLVTLISGFAFKSDYFAEDGQKLITPKNFTTFGKASFTLINTKWTTEEADKKYLCCPNDLLVLLTDLTQSCELLGRPVLLNEDDGEVLLNQRIIKVITNEKIDKLFLLYLLLTDNYHELIVSTASGTTVKHSSNKVIQSFEFLLPCFEEQTKIANFLSSLDQKIEGVAQQIEHAKQWKKGLLQQMFV